MRTSCSLLLLCLCPSATTAQDKPAPRAVEIFEIQGSGASSPLDGTIVTTASNVVTACAKNGFFVQTPDDRDDGDPATSSGLFVFTSGAPGVAVGQLVDVTGEVQEYFGATEITHARVQVISSASPLPEPVHWDATVPNPRATDPTAAFERFEGMLVEFENGVICEAKNRFGEYVAASRPQRAFREPGIKYPGLPGLPVWDGNPELFEIVPDGVGHADFDLPAGASITRCLGVVGFAFGSYQVLPTDIDFRGVMEPAPLRQGEPGELVIATFNLHNLFDDQDDPTLGEDVVTQAELERRIAKHSMAITRVLRTPDILCVQEVESSAVLEALAARIAADDPDTSYRAHLLPGNDPGGRNVGFLLGDRVLALEVVQLGREETFNGGDRPRPLFSRPPLVLDARWETDRGSLDLRIVNVHLRSLIGIEDEPVVRERRFAQTRWLATRLHELQQTAAGGRLVLAGDLNAYPFTDGYVDVVGLLSGELDPLGAQLAAPAVVDPPLENQIDRVPATERYSLVYKGNAAALDHVLLSHALDELVTGAGFARVGADFPASLEARGDTAMRASDHDALVVWIRAETPAAPFVRGDADANGSIEPSDALAVLARLFRGQRERGCLAAGDVDGDGTLNLTDAVRLLNFLFAGGSPPAAPYPVCEPDPTSPPCASFAPCE